MTQSTKKRGALLATALLIGSSLNTLAGDGKPNGKMMLEKKPDANPLSFADGKITFDFQELGGKSGQTNVRLFSTRNAPVATTDC